MKWSSTPFVLCNLPSASSGFPSPAGGLWPRAQPCGTLTDNAPSDDLTGPRAPANRTPATMRPIRRTPAMADCNQLMRCQLGPAGAGSGATEVGWTTAGGGCGSAPGSAATSGTWQLGQAVSPFEYHVQQLRQTARLTDGPLGRQRCARGNHCKERARQKPGGLNMKGSA